jgi:hypothetical protein
VGGSIGGGYGGSAIYTISYKLTMKTESNELSNLASINELVQVMEKYPDAYQHLKVFLRRENSTGIPDFGEEYLGVSPSGFGLYCINSTDYENGRIILSLTETSTNKVVSYSIDINNQTPTCLFIRWKDVKSMVFQGCMESDQNDEDLLELIED